MMIAHLQDGESQNAITHIGDYARAVLAPNQEVGHDGTKYAEGRKSGRIARSKEAA
jgi:hypothetical protein